MEPSVLRADGPIDWAMRGCEVAGMLAFRLIFLLTVDCEAGGTGEA